MININIMFMGDSWIIKSLYRGNIKQNWENSPLFPVWCGRQTAGWWLMPGPVSPPTTPPPWTPGSLSSPRCRPPSRWTTSTWGRRPPPPATNQLGPLRPWLSLSMRALPGGTDQGNQGGSLPAPPNRRLIIPNMPKVSLRPDLLRQK